MRASLQTICAWNSPWLPVTTVYSASEVFKQPIPENAPGMQILEDKATPLNYKIFIYLPYSFLLSVIIK